MTGIRATASVLVAVVFLGACDKLGTDRCRQLPGHPVERLSSVEWGAGKVTADIRDVQSECVRIAGMRDETYRISLLAKVHYAILDSAFFRRATAYRDLEAPVVFLAVSGSGVALDSAVAMFRVVHGGTDDVANGTMVVSPEVMHRIVSIGARWQFGH